MESNKSIYYLFKLILRFFSPLISHTLSSALVLDDDAMTFDMDSGRLLEGDTLFYADRNLGLVFYMSGDKTPVSTPKACRHNTSWV